MLRRQFHSSRLLAFKQKNEAKTKKSRTPSKGKDVEHRSFRKAASYSKFHQQAPDVTDVPVLQMDSLATGVHTYADAIQAALVHSGSFPPQQGNELFKTHTSLFRQQTLAFLNGLQNSRQVITGPGGIGKTTLLSQAHAFAKANNWAVLHVPRAMTLIDGSTDHVEAGDGSWLQPMYVRRWFKSIRKANKDVLSNGASQILTKGEAPSLPELFEQLAKDEVKILLSIDNINAWSHQPYAVNRTKDNEPIYHGDLQVPRLVLDYLSGSKKLEGCVLAATTGLYKTNKTFDVAFGNAETHAYAPITEFDPTLSSKLSGAKEQRVEYWNIDEVRAWCDYLEKAGIATKRQIEQRFAESNGNPRHILQSYVNYSF